MPPVRQTIEEQKRPDGSSTIQSTTYTTDINGNTQVTEKSVTDTQKNGSGETSETVVQRPTVNGLGDGGKAKPAVVSKQGNGYQSESTTYRSDGNGGFYPAVRQTTEHTVQGSEASDNSAEYERGSNGELQLHGQTVTKTVTRPDGSKDSVVDIYSRERSRHRERQRIGVKAAGTANDREHARAQAIRWFKRSAFEGRPSPIQERWGRRASFLRPCARAIAKPTK